MQPAEPIYETKCKKTIQTGIGGGMYDVYLISETGYEFRIGSVQRWWNAETGARGYWFNGAEGKDVRHASKNAAVQALKKSWEDSQAKAGAEAEGAALVKPGVHTLPGCAVKIFCQAACNCACHQ